MKHPITAEAFTEWVGRQPPEQEYNFANPSICAIGQYATLLGVDWVFVQDRLCRPGREGWWMSPVGKALTDAKFRLTRGGLFDTFGALHKRLIASMKTLDQDHATGHIENVPVE